MDETIILSFFVDNYSLNKDENVHRYAVREGEKIEKEREIDRERERGREREIERERLIKNSMKKK